MTECPKDQPLEKVSLFSGLSEGDLEIIAQHTVVKTFPANTVVLLEGEKSDSLYMILEGKVKVFASEDAGNEVILSIQSRGEFFGEMTLVDDAPRSASVVTIQPTRLMMMSRAAFLECLTAHPEVAYNLIRVLIARVRVLTDNIKSLALLDVYGRVARTLLSLAAPVGNRLIVQQKLTHQEIANMVGASREMVTRILKDLKDRGAISINRKYITIHQDLSAPL